MRELLQHPLYLRREINNKSLYEFLQYFWPVVSKNKFQPNWHIAYLCKELERVAERVGQRLPRENDLVINVPPGSSKTITASIMFPAWCWTRWYGMRFICASYSSALSLESAEYCRELLRSSEFQDIYPEISIKEDKDTKSNFRIVKKIFGSVGRRQAELAGGGRFSTSVGGTLVGFHGDILIVDDPLNPNQAASEIELANANRWMEQTLSTRKTDKSVTPTILIMQRLHQDDPAGHMLAKQKENIRHICLPGECRNYREQVKPIEVLQNYVDDLLDPHRMSWTVLADLEADLGQYGYAGQIGQDPTPPGGGMFKVDHFQFISQLPPPVNFLQTIRYWDKAATQDGGMYTAGVKMSRLTGNRWLIEDVKRGRWSTHERERIIRETAEADGKNVEIWIEQEPGPVWEEELVQMTNGTRKKLKDVKAGDFIINKDGKSAKVDEVFLQGELPALKITTDSGRIINVAKNHPVLTPNGWVDAGFLKEGDILALKVQSDMEATSFPSLEECRLAGYFIGDGCCTWIKGKGKGKEVTCNSNIVCSDPAEGADIVHCSEKLGFTVRIGGSKGWTYSISGGCRDWLKARGLAGKNTFQKRIPDWVLQANNECLANFLGAFLACDGSVANGKDHPCVEYYGTNLELLKDVQSSLLRFGIYVMLRKRNYKDEFQKTRHSCYRLTTRRSDGSMGRFAKYIPVFGVKGVRLETFNLLNFDQPYISDPITSIKDGGDLPCRCLGISEGESFLVNDIVVHNSGGKESAEGTIRNLAGFVVYAERPTGDKAFRADPYSVQVNNGAFSLFVNPLWNRVFVEEHRFFPFSTYKDQVDASSGAFNKLVGKKIARRIT
jgi:phage terminase large subunit-like protein